MSPVEWPPEPVPLKEGKGKEPDMAAFRSEISALIAKRNVPGEVTMNVNQLDETDAIIWYKSNNPETKPAALMQDFPEYIADVEILQNTNRRLFAQIIANVIQGRVSKRAA